MRRFAGPGPACGHAVCRYEPACQLVPREDEVHRLRARVLALRSQVTSDPDEAERLGLLVAQCAARYAVLTGDTEEWRTWHRLAQVAARGREAERRARYAEAAYARRHHERRRVAQAASVAP